MNERSLHADSFAELKPAQLARLLEAGETEPAWSAADAAAALRQQLGASLLPDLELCPGAERERLAQRIKSCSDTATFFEQLTSGEADVELLEAIKRWARHMRGVAHTPLREGPATVIYYAAIAAGLRRGRRITTLSNEALREGFAWAGKQAGAEGLTGSFEGALRGL